MKPLLMFSDRDFTVLTERSVRQQALIQDLELGTLLTVMAEGDELLYTVAESALVCAPGNSLDTILRRQAVLTDCGKNPDIIRGLYELANQAIQIDRHSYRRVFNWPAAVLRESAELLYKFVELLQKLQVLARTNAGQFESEGFRTLFAMLQRELGDAYLSEITQQLAEFRSDKGMLLSATLGAGNRGTDYRLQKSSQNRENLMQRLFGRHPAQFTFHLHPRDESGARALGEIRDQAVNSAASALAQSADHILAFFNGLRLELAFYLGCLNLHKQLSAQGIPLCLPEPAEHGATLCGRALYDPCLALKLDQRAVTNDLDMSDRSLLVITGANQGGKSTFLRALGVAQLMLQAGMFVPAEAFRARLCSQLFTHYRREEDAALVSGKLDEELERMSAIVNEITPDSVLLLNESFAATNEREGSEIARQIVGALLERGVRILFVTHLYEFAHRCHHECGSNAVFLQPERRSDGERTFKMLPGCPLQTSYGEDLYRELFVAN